MSAISDASGRGGGMRSRPEGWTAAAGFGGVAALTAAAVLRPEMGLASAAVLTGAALAACAPALACARAALSGPPSPVAEAGGRGPSGPAPALVPRSRRHVRIALRDARTSILTEDRRRLQALVIDVSQSGVAIEGNLPGLWVGSMVTVGRRRAKAVRVLPRGMAFEFSAPIPAEDLRPDLVL